MSEIKGLHFVTIIIGLLSGTRVSLAFQAGQFNEFKPFDYPEGMGSDLGFVSSKIEVREVLVPLYKFILLCIL